MKTDDRKDVFGLSVTEFVILIVFVLLLLVTFYADKNHSLANDLEEIEQIKRELKETSELVTELSTKLGFKQDKRDLTEVEKIQNFISWLRGLVRNDEINIKDHWDILVVVVDQIEGGILTPTEAKDLKYTLEEVRRLKLKLRDVEGTLASCEASLGRAKGFINVTRERCGTGYPNCIEGTWLASLVLNDDSISVMPDTQPADASTVFEARKYNLEEFTDVADSLYEHSTLQPLECRYQVKWTDATGEQSKLRFKEYLRVINSSFNNKEIEQQQRIDSG